MSSLYPIRLLEITGLAHGGSGAHVLRLVERLNPKLFDVTVAMAAGSPLQSAFEAIPCVRTVPVRLDHGGSPLLNLLGFMDLWRLMSSKRFDVVVTNTSVAGMIGRTAAKLHGQHIVIHMIHAYASHDLVQPLKRSAVRAAERAMDWLTDGYIAGTDAMVDWGVKARIFRRGKATRIHNGIDIEALRQAAPGRTAARRHFGLSDQALVVGFAGRLERQKGCETLLDCVPALLSRVPTVFVLLAGDGKLRQPLEAQAERLGIASRVFFAGWQQSPAIAYRAMDVMAMPSRWEAFGLVAAEAMALGVPVVASNVDGLPEVIQDGVTGLLVPVDDTVALGDALARLLLNKATREQFGAAAEERVERLFDISAMVSAHEGLFSRSISEAFGRSAVIRR